MQKIIILFAFLHAWSANGFFLNNPSPTGSSQLSPLAESPLRIGSFNIQVLGVSKVSHTAVVDVLVKILSRYDVVLVLEIRDATHTAFESLRVALNNYVHKTEPGVVYDSVVSTRLGRTNSKEQYGFLYRPSRVSVAGTYQYIDTHDVFEREPFGVRFKSPSTAVEDFIMIATHIQPSMAAEEMDNLTQVYERFKSHWHVSNIIIAGDFNADCNYLRLSDWKNISLRLDSRFDWLLGDDVDTTVATSACSYDRFVVAGSALQSTVLRNSLQAYRFDEVMGLSKDMALQVSDHYPIEMHLAGKPNAAVQEHIDTSISFTVKDNIPSNDVNAIRAMYHTPHCAGSEFVITVLRKETHMDFVQAVYLTQNISDIMPKITQFSANCTGTLSTELLSMLKGYQDSNVLSSMKPDVYGIVYDLKKLVYTTIVKCSLIAPYVCEVTVSRIIS